MRKHILYTALLIFVCVYARTQDNLQIQNAYKGTAAAARYLPSTQLALDYKLEISFNYNFWLANKSLTYGSLRQIQKENRLTKEDIENIINDLDENNRIGLSQDFLILGLGLKTNIKEHPVVWNFTISDRFNVNLLIPKSLLQLVWQGNKQFAGESIDLSKTSISGLYFRDYSFGFATQIKEWDNWNVRAGMRMSYYQGISGIQNQKKQFYFTTAAEAEYIRLDYDFEYRYTGIDDFDLFNTRGHGFGISLGTSFSYKEALFFDIGLTDLGRIKFTQDIYKIGTKNDFRFSGLGLDELINPTAFLDSLETVFTPEIDSLGTNSFTMSVGTRLAIAASWVYGKETRVHSKKTLSLYYSQGFSEQPGSTTYPMLSVAFHQSVFSHFVYGLSASFGGFNDFAVGALLGLQFKHYCFSFQSDDITGFIFPENTTGAGFGIIFQILI